MTDPKDARIAELEAQLTQMCEAKDLLVDRLKEFTDARIINGGEVLLVNKLEQERDKLRELCREMRADLIAEVHEKYDYKWGDTKEWQDAIDNDIAQLKSIKKADAILGADNE